VLPPLMLTVGVCYAIHVITTFAEHVALESETDGALQHGLRHRALAATLREVSRPALFTALTTAAGFASFYNSGLESLVRFGWIAAFGVIAALAAALVLLPLALLRVPARWIDAPRAHSGWSHLVAAVADHVGRRRGAILVGALLFTALGVWGTTRLSIDASFEQVYGEKSRVVRWAREAAALRGADTLEVAIFLPKELGPASLPALAAVERIERLAALEGIGRPLSVLVPMRELNTLLHQDTLALSGSDARADRPEQLLRMMRAEQPELVRAFAVPAEDGAPAALRVSFQGEKLPQHELRALVERVRSEAGAALPPGASVIVTGPLAVVSQMIDEIRDTQVGSFASALGLVFVLTAIGLRSLRLALVAMIPTTIPVTLTLGAMGFLGIPLDMGTAMVASVLLGLGVDEALHLLAGYQRQRAAGLARASAMDASLREVGRALFTSAGALAAGFLVLFFVPWQSLASFGLVTGVAIGASLLADLLLLPAVMGSRRA
jgi:hypothetical protein